MSRVGRPNTEPKTLYQGNVPADLARKVDLLLMDPDTGKVRYGSRSQLLEQLLREWLNKQRALFAGGAEQDSLGFKPDIARYTAGGKGGDKP